MYKKLKIVKVDFKYCDYLRNYDEKVVYNAGTKELRPFIGILFYVGRYEYFAPLSSQKLKHKNLKNTLDLIKIKSGEYGVVNLNNMIPVTNKNYEEFDLNAKPSDKNEINRLKLMNKQLRWLTSNKNVIYNKSKLLYNLYVNNNLPVNVKKRCCDFKLLEEKCKEYNNI